MTVSARAATTARAARFIRPSCKGKSSVAVFNAQSQQTLAHGLGLRSSSSSPSGRRLRDHLVADAGAPPAPQASTPGPKMTSRSVSLPPSHLAAGLVPAKRARRSDRSNTIANVRSDQLMEPDAAPVMDGESGSHHCDTKLIDSSLASAASSASIENWSRNGCWHPGYGMGSDRPRSNQGVRVELRPAQVEVDTFSAGRGNRDRSNGQKAVHRPSATCGRSFMQRARRVRRFFLHRANFRIPPGRARALREWHYRGAAHDARLEAAADA